MLRLLETTFPLTSAIVLDVVRMRLRCGSDAAWICFGCGSDVAQTWFERGSDVVRTCFRTGCKQSGRSSGKVVPSRWGSKFDVHPKPEHERKEPWSGQASDSELLRLGPIPKSPIKCSKSREASMADSRKVSDLP